MPTSSQPQTQDDQLLNSIVYHYLSKTGHGNLAEMFRTEFCIDDKDLINTKATSKQGDYVVISSLDGTVAWQVTEVRGTFAKEA